MNTKNINKDKTNKEGYALITVVVVMVVMSILFLSAYTLIQSNTKQIIAQENNLRAHYLARSGATLAYTAIVEGEENLLNDFNSSNYNSKEEGKSDTIEFSDEEAKAEVIAWHDNGYIYISSKSTLNKTSNTSEIFLKFEKNNPEKVNWLKNLD